jgi:hypothetical protein
MADGRLPIRILYKGASTVMWQSSTDRRPPGLLPYPRVVEAALRSRGHDVHTDVAALSAVRASSILRDWEEEATSVAPDVVVLHYGHMETIHLLIPKLFERHARAGRERPGRVRDLYRDRVLRPAWKAAAILQQRVDRALPAPLARRIAERRAARVVAHLERYVSRLGRLTSPLVVVMGLMESGPVWHDWFPGITTRMPRMDRALRDMVDRDRTGRLVFVDLWDEAAAWDARGVDPRPDGGHYTEEFHRVVGERLAETIATWAATQPHLLLDVRRGAPVADDPAR